VKDEIEKIKLLYLLVSFTKKVNGNHNYTSIKISCNSTILLNPLSAVTRVNPSSIAVAAIIASGNGIFICLLIKMALFFILFVKGMMLQKLIAVSLIIISSALTSFIPKISISVITEIKGSISK
jgi:hypothetical protein